MADATTITTVPGTKLILGSSSDKKGITISPTTVYYNGNIVKGIMDSDKTHLFWKNGIYNAVNEAIPTLTSNTSTDGIVISSYSGSYSEDSSTYTYKTFTATGFKLNETDSIIGESYTSSYNYYSTKYNLKAYIKVQFPSPITIGKIEIQGIPSTGSDWSYKLTMINSVYFQGSNDDTNYTDLIEINNISGSEIIYYENNNIKDSFTYYRLYMPKFTFFVRGSKISSAGSIAYFTCRFKNVQFYTI